MLRSAPYIYFWEIFQSDLTAIEVAKFTPSDLPKWSPRNWAIWGLIRLLVCGEGQIESHREVGQMRLSLVRTERAFRVGRSLNEGAATPRNVVTARHCKKLANGSHFNDDWCSAFEIIGWKSAIPTSFGKHLVFCPQRPTDVWSGKQWLSKIFSRKI